MDIALSKHKNYINSILKFNPQLLKQSKFKKLNQDVLNLIFKNNELILAGGALRNIIDPNETIVDYDIFFQKEIDIKKIIKKFNEINFFVEWECPKGELYNLSNGKEKVQLILPNNPKPPNEWLDEFDINAGRIALTKDLFYIDKNAISDIKKKLITLNKVSFPVATFFRIYKYKNKGYRIFNDTVRDFFIKTTLARELDPESWEKYSID